MFSEFNVVWHKITIINCAAKLVYARYLLRLVHTGTKLQVFSTHKEFKKKISIISRNEWGNPIGGVANLLDCDIEVSEFELQSPNYIHFRTKIFGKGMNSLNPWL